MAFVLYVQYSVTHSLVHINSVPLFQVGMIAWRMTMLTPEYPEGRDVIVIANDITHQIGSFGPQEDLVFKVTKTHIQIVSQGEFCNIFRICILEIYECRQLHSIILSVKSWLATS